ncbi:hypothetical protein [Gimesia panareensis]|uniref:hypothetical protein n=1 Tax=Gimesia panareensis TaxID=2527978 RepID=UPI00118C0827|nr:hypothetical protein [Gimesia panareensis]QDU49594.1 hypothetical protein Pan110_19320 [Gimesia panareensis]
MNPTNDNQTVLRREFIRLFAGMVGSLGIPGVFSGDAEAADNEIASGLSLDDSYLDKGLIGMSRSKGWFNAHLGAAVLAGYYMCKENQLSEETVVGIKKQLDILIQIHQAQFNPFSKMTADESLIENVPTSLAPAVEGGLRAHGHAVIYTALSTRALRDAPHMADPRLIKLLCAHNGAIAKKKPVQPGVRSDYPDSQAMVEALFDSLKRFKPLLGHPTVRRPNFTHMTTHTEALMSLEAMGYQELAKTGQLGQQAHIAEPVPKFDPAEHPLEEHQVSLEEIMSEKYWENQGNQKQWRKAWNVKTNPNGYWVAFGHLFKVLYSYHRLIGHIKDRDKVRLCSQILLERYVNPNVQGG